MTIARVWRGASTAEDAEAYVAYLWRQISPQMVARCKAKGLNAKEADLLNLGLPPGSFDAVYSMNCFLHVPNAELPDALKAIHQVLRPGGLFFLGVYGGDFFEGDALEDWHVPPRFFSFRTDEQMLAFTSNCFDVLDFHVVGSQDRHFQSPALRKRGSPSS
jgi:SAM-dependent methyltransferase